MRRVPRGTRRARTAIITTAIPAILLIISGCASAPPSYSERTQWPQKDVALISIRIEEKLSAAEYLEIVEHEQAEFFMQQKDSIVPVYQVRFQFLLTGESSPLAEVTIVSGRDELSGLTLFSPPSVIIY